MPKYRQLTRPEQEKLILNGCGSTDWNRVYVQDGFNPDRYVRVDFSGDIYLGATDRSVVNTAGIECPSGIYNSAVNNCTIGDNVRISNIGECISGYVIGNNCLISNVGLLSTRPGATFGNGTKVCVLNETGGRENIIYDRMSAQIAYIMTFYRHDSALIAGLSEIINRYVESKRADAGHIGDNSVLANCGTISDVNIGTNAKIDGALRLFDGTVGDFATVGPGVVGEHFIIQSQAVVDNASILKNTLVGQASKVSNCFVAHDSMFFSNCALECGEAVATFAGPHTVSMHKSSLLIGGYFSFFNAGSGTNQSNHLYKLGPVHQGIMERGCKTSSNSYVMWPARFGAFTLVSGSHYHHPDTSDFPYSYAIAVDGATVVIPAANLKTIGTIRDLLKWKSRDRRSAEMPRYDLTTYDTLSPVTTNGMFKGITSLNRLDSDPEYLSEHHIDIPAATIKKGKEYYAIGIEYFMGEGFVQRLLSLNLQPGQNFKEQLTSGLEKSYDKWVDICRLIAPKSLVDEVCSDIASGTIDTIDRIEDALAELKRRYYDLKWAYVLSNFNHCYGISIEDLTPESAITVINRWRESVSVLDRMRRQDAMKDYLDEMSVGFGIDEPECRRTDFLSVNGVPEENHVIVTIHQHYTDALLDAHEIISRIKKTFAITD